MNTTKERSRASVVLMRGNGEERLRQALMQGLVREEIVADVEEVLKRADDMQRENERLSANYYGATKRVAEYERIYSGAVEAYQREEARRKKRSELKSDALFISVIFLIVLVSTIVSEIIGRAIFG